ncbi:MAG: preprotein translocase subunit SecG [Bacteroidales bacterium]|nr:preprotein translocase subunit SecG [Bacteroidales bacterium]
MYTAIVVIILFICVILAIVVLVQNSKGGGLASNFQSQNQYMGVRKTADFLEKASWTLAVLLMVLSLACVAFVPKHTNDEKQNTESGIKLDNVNIPMSNPTTTTAPAPATENAAPAAQPEAE